MISRFFTCSVPDCSQPSCRDFGGCDSCGRYLCRTHMSRSFHTCPEDDDSGTGFTLTAEIDRLSSRINDNAVCALASSLNRGKACNIEHTETTGPDVLTGGANYHARIRFHNNDDNNDDNKIQPSTECWLLRVPRVTGYATSLPESLAAYLVRSEYATLKFLENTTVPAPRAFAYGVCGSEMHHNVGVSFLLMEELPGKPWTGDGVDGSTASTEEKAKIWSGLADILGELSKYPFPKAGSLLESPGSSVIEVSAQASDRFLGLLPYGPFDNALSYYTVFAQQYLGIIADGQLYAEYPVDAYLAYCFLRDHAAAQLVDQGNDRCFFLKHVDDRGDHLLVDENLNITGIIDWQMARVVPAREAFGPSLVTADVSALCDGHASFGEDDIALGAALEQKGYPELARFALAGDEKTRRFFWGLGVEQEWLDALPLANAILQTFGVDMEWEEWKEVALRKYRNDSRLQRLVASASP